MKFTLQKDVSTNNSIIPLIIIHFHFNIYILYLLLFNSIASGMDLYSFFIIKRLPKNSIIIFRNNKIYYRK